MKNSTSSAKVLKVSAKAIPATLLKAPPKLANAFTAMAAAAAKTTPAPAPATAKKAAAKTVAVTTPTKPAGAEKPAAFVHTVQNGRKDYRPGTTGFKIFEACDRLTTDHPGIALTAKVLEVALPGENTSSLGCGLSHWRQFRGLTKTLLAAKAAANAK